ncbi:MAG: type leader peptidase [Chitinophagaceae bacterium]|nr:type leader peptidase [Chitinophagaceae bacterium]
MQWMVFLAEVFLLLAIAFEDFKSRTVHAILFPIVFALSVLYAFYHLDGYSIVENITFSFGFLLLQGILLVLYFVIKQKRWINITNGYLGWGDILFMLAILPFFSPTAYVLFYLVSLIVTMLFVVVYRIVFKKMVFIPLAGIQALCLVIVLYYHQIVSPVLFDYFLPLTM